MKQKAFHLEYVLNFNNFFHDDIAEYGTGAVVQNKDNETRNSKVLETRGSAHF